MSVMAKVTAQAYPLQPVRAGINRVLAGGWKGKPLTCWECIRDDATGNGFFISFSSHFALQFIVYYPITLADDSRNPRIEGEAHAAAKNFMDMLNVRRVE